MADGYGYQGGSGGDSPQYLPMMPQQGVPSSVTSPAPRQWQGGAWPAQQMPQAGPVTGPLPDTGEEDGFAVPARLGLGGTVPVTRCPDGSWAMSFMTGEGELHTLVYVRLQDGTFAPYHLEGVGALRMAPDATGGQAWLTQIPARSGKPVHVLHVPGDATRLQGTGDQLMVAT